MSMRPPDGSVAPATPIYDETIEATAVRDPYLAEAEYAVPATGDDAPAQGKGGAAKEQAGQVAGTAKEQAGQVAGTAKEQAGQVAGTAKDAGSRVAGTTKDQASRVASDAVGQAKDLYGQATTQLSEQAGTQQERAASALKTLGTDLGAMRRGEGTGDGLAGELVDAITKRADGLSHWLEQRDPADVLDEVKQFAARRPGLFIALAAVTGVVAARATKALTAEARDEHAGTGTSARTGTPARTETSSRPVTAVDPDRAEYFSAPTDGFAR